MTGSALPHSAVVAAQLDDFLKAVSTEVVGNTSQISKSQAFRGIFKTSLAAHAALEEFRRGELALLKSASGIARRIPMLLSCRQLSLAHVELRRFIEVVSWYPYFREHPVEWNEFTQHPEAGIVREVTDPIRFAAHRDLAWHHAYIAARYRDLDWIGKTTRIFATGYATLSVHAHAAIPAMAGSVSLPFDQMDENGLKSLHSIQKEILAAGCLIVAAAKPQSLFKLPAVERAWFDWLVGKDMAKVIRVSAVGGATHTRPTRPAATRPRRPKRRKSLG